MRRYGQVKVPDEALAFEIAAKARRKGLVVQVALSGSGWWVVRARALSRREVWRR